MKKFFYVCVAIATVLINANSAKATPIGLIEKVQLPALLSFDYAAEMLGVQYGADPTYPSLTASGVIEGTGFQWNLTSAAYQGKTLSWFATGTYDQNLDSINWTGGGSYDGHLWSLAGDVKWLSSTDFQIRHSYSIEGLQYTYTGDEDGLPGWDDGIADDPVSVVEYKIERSKTWFLGPRKKIDNVKVTVSGDVITKDTLKIIDDKDKVGIEVKNIGGTIEIGGGEFHKTIEIQPIPEPSTLLLFVSGLAGLTGYGRKRLFKKV